MASYHFPMDDAEGPCYISYQETTRWTLDNGQRPPAKKYWTNVSYDSVLRTFRGTVDWRPTTFGGAAWIRYEMQFPVDFKIIASGSVTCYNDAGKFKERFEFGPGKHLDYKLFE